MFIFANGDVDFPNTGAGAAQIYEFEYQVNGVCANDYATLIVEIYGEDTAGTDAILIVCPGENFTEYDLFDALGGNPSIRGDWVESINGPGNYTYAVEDNSGFIADQAIVTVIEEELKSAGQNGQLLICEGVIPSEDDLFMALGDTADVGGSWSLTTAGVYKYSFMSTCFSVVSATVTLVEEPQKSAGENGTLEIDNGTIVTETQLFEALQGNPDPGGIWTPELAGEGTYIYTHLADVCLEASAEVVVVEGSLSIKGEDLSTVSLYPNPVKTVIKILNTNNLDIKSIELFTITGQLIMRIDDNFTEINVSKLESAIYFLQINTREGQKTMRFIKG